LIGHPLRFSPVYESKLPYFPLEYLNIPAAERTTNKWLRLHENFAKIRRNNLTSRFLQQGTGAVSRGDASSRCQDAKV
jgi:hypothetical protein